MSRTVRAYLPATSGTLRTLRTRGELPPGVAFAVTPALREATGEDDPELLEYEAFGLAAEASLDLLRADPEQPHRRVVISVDAEVVPAQGARVGLPAPVRRSAVVAVHLDGAAAEAAVRAVLAGERSEVDYPLEWYDVSELDWLPA